MVLPQAFQISVPLFSFAFFDHDFGSLAQVFTRFLVGLWLDLGDQSFRLILPDGNCSIRGMGLNGRGDGIVVNAVPPVSFLMKLVVPIQHTFGLLFQNRYFDKFAYHWKPVFVSRFRYTQAGTRKGPILLFPGRLTIFQVMKQGLAHLSPCLDLASGFFAVFKRLRGGAAYKFFGLYGRHRGPVLLSLSNFSKLIAQSGGSSRPFIFYSVNSLPNPSFGLLEASRRNQVIDQPFIIARLLGLSLTQGYDLVLAAGPFQGMDGPIIRIPE